MNDKKIYRVADKQISVYCDLSKIVCAPLNDMVVASDGRCYVGDIGYDFYAGAPRATGGITLIEPDGSARRVMSGMECPNGMLIREGGRKLCVAESFANRVMEFDRDSLGNLSNPRLLIELPREVPDGICLADDGCIWVACYMGSRFVCVDPSGRMVAQVMLTGRNAVACQLGGGDGRTLFCLTYEGSFEDMSAGVPGARIEVARVDVKAAGSP
jgi:sugar lactone lactonase YvrE